MTVTEALLVLVLSAIALVGTAAYYAFGTEYMMVSDANKTYCTEFARRVAMPYVDRMPAMVSAYGDCIRILPTRLPLPEEAGSVPASDRPASSDDGWAEACDREYRTWDAATRTVIRRGSPDRVECPLVLVDGKWQIVEP